MRLIDPRTLPAKKLEKWKTARALGRRRFIVRHGVLWGFLVELLWIPFMWYAQFHWQDPFPTHHFRLFLLIVGATCFWLAAGLAYGAILWKLGSYGDPWMD